MYIITCERRNYDEWQESVTKREGGKESERGDGERGRDGEQRRDRERRRDGLRTKIHGWHKLR